MSKFKLADISLPSAKKLSEKIFAEDHCVDACKKFTPIQHVLIHGYAYFVEGWVQIGEDACGLKGAESVSMPGLLIDEMIKYKIINRKTLFGQKRWQESFDIYFENGRYTV